MKIKLQPWLSLRVWLINPSETRSTKSNSQLPLKHFPSTQKCTHTLISPHELEMGLWTYNVSSDSWAPPTVFLFLMRGLNHEQALYNTDDTMLVLLCATQSLQEEQCWMRGAGGQNKILLLAALAPKWHSWTGWRLVSGKNIPDFA